MERQTGKIRGTFSRMHRALDGWMLAIAHRLDQLKTRTTMDLGFSSFLIFVRYISVPASPDQGHDRLCRRGVGRVFLAGVRPDSPSRRRIPSCYRPGPGRGVVVELGQRGAH